MKDIQIKIKFLIPMQKITLWIRGIPAYILAENWRRFFALASAAGLGIGLWWLSHELVQRFFSYQEHVTGWIEIFLLSVFVLLTLWWFRTHDTREQIKQNEYFNGLKNLTSSDPLKIDVGVDQLIRLSKATAAFNDGIKLAFIKRLKTHLIDTSLKSKNQHKRLTYAQWILSWLVDNYSDEEMDLNGCDFINQDFELLGFQFAKIFNNDGKSKAENMILTNIFLQNADLKNTNLQNADLSNANLQNANLRNANLVGARLFGARLMGADLTDANLENADFSYYIQEVIDKTHSETGNYTSANLSGADLTGAKLTDEKLLGAIIDDDTKGLKERFYIETNDKLHIIFCKMK